MNGKKVARVICIAGSSLDMNVDIVNPKGYHNTVIKYIHAANLKQSHKSLPGML